MEKQNIWDMEESIATNLEELEQLKDHSEDLKGKIVTVKGIVLDDSLCDILYEISYNGQPKKNYVLLNALWTKHFQYLVPFIYHQHQTLAMNDYDFTPKDGLEIVNGLNLYNSTKLDLSNNKMDAKNY